MTAMNKIDSKAMLQDVVAFLWEEADILDRKDYDTWLNLWIESGYYTMPIGDTEDFDNALNLCHDNHKMRKDRIGRFQQGFAISSAPPAQTVRTLSRFVIEKAEGDLITVRSALHMIEDKFGRQRIWAANIKHELQVTDACFKIRNKVVRLINSDGMLNSFSYLF